MGKVLKMEVPIVTITYGFFMISLGVTMLFLYRRHVDSDVIRFSHESHKARQLWRLLRSQHIRRLNISSIE
jgi:hypothetical protein